MAGKTFYQGDLREEYRGYAAGCDVAFIFRNSGFLRMRLGSVTLSDAIRTTEKNPVERAYFGINTEGCKVVHDNYDKPDLGDLDKLLLTEGALSK